jgi:hypothetical protein
LIGYGFLCLGVLGVLGGLSAFIPSNIPQLIQLVQRRHLVRLGQGREIEDVADEILGRALEHHDGLLLSLPGIFLWLVFVPNADKEST